MLILFHHVWSLTHTTHIHTLLVLLLLVISSSVDELKRDLPIDSFLYGGTSVMLIVYVFRNLYLLVLVRHSGLSALRSVLTYVDDDDDVLSLIFPTG